MSQREPTDLDLQKVFDDARKDDRPQQHEAELRRPVRRVDQLAGPHHRPDDDQSRSQRRQRSEEAARRVADSISAVSVRVRHAAFRSLIDVCWGAAGERCLRSAGGDFKLGLFDGGIAANELSQRRQCGRVVADEGSGSHFDLSGVNAAR